MMERRKVSYDSEIGTSSWVISLYYAYYPFLRQPAVLLMKSCVRQYYVTVLLVMLFEAFVA